MKYQILHKSQFIFENIMILTIHERKEVSYINIKCNNKFIFQARLTIKPHLKIKIQHLICTSSHLYMIIT